MKNSKIEIMNNQINLPRCFWLTLVAFSIACLAKAQPNNNDPSQLSQTILHHDSIFWAAYNSCNIKMMTSYMSEDFEFYHDKGGLTSTRSVFKDLLEKGLCDPKNPRTRREEIKESIQVFPLNNYGAILTGEHLFYVKEKGENEKLTEIAKFTHVWKFKNNQWKMTRVLSYDHQPAPLDYERKKMNLTKEILESYTGNYAAPMTGRVMVLKKEDALELSSDKRKFTIYPKSESLFFHEKSDLTFEFIKNEKGKVVKILVRENGELVEEARKVDL